MRPSEFSRRVLRWHAAHGRKDLPWQRDPTPYRVWISEIMLQQTRVSAVIPYYERFMERFADVRALAQAELDEVLHLWTGLGYYARARNLHRAARIIGERHADEFPRDIESVQALPGIGRSTAGAILALGCGQRHPILDGNVKRVLARYHAVDGWPGRSDVQRELWALSDQMTPSRDARHYTQAIMDLGATVCAPKNPSCHECPVSKDCAALAQNRVQALPASRPKRPLPLRKTTMLMLSDGDAVLLQKRPPTGIWGGLWGFPEMEGAGSDAQLRKWCRDHLRVEVDSVQRWQPLRHTFSHFQLDILPVHARVRAEPPGVMEAPAMVWYNTRQPDARGLAAPVKRLLDRLRHPDQGEAS